MRLAIGAAATGAGKTTFTVGLAGALRRRGLVVQAFKAGPDYIDPTYHTHATGRPARNLDTWIVPPDALRELFGRAASMADVSLVEGMMGLFDGRGDGEEGSTAHLAKLLDLPVVVLLDVGGASRTAGAVALGCQRFDPDLRVVGYVLNGIGGETHRRWVTRAVTGATDLPVFGALPRRPELTLPERHLGLVPFPEHPVAEDVFERLADLVEETCDLDALLAAGVPPPAASISGLSALEHPLFPMTPVLSRVRIGIARDEAFGFYYADNLDLLRAHGAELVNFSPLRDEALPSGIGALYLGGGFPEVYAARLSNNVAMREAIRLAAREGLPIFAECGGLMYLSESIVDLAGVLHPMVGLVPSDTSIARRGLTLGYRELRARVDLPVLRAGEVARGHEFHWSVLERPLPPANAAFDVLGAPVPVEGYVAGPLLASYCHLHFGSNPSIAPNFVAIGKGTGRTG